MLDLVCLGEPLIEFNEQPDGRYLRGFGGDVSNCAVAAARLGAKTGLLTRLGDDSFGDAITAMLTHEGVDISAIERDAAVPTGIYFVTHDEGGHHFEYRRAGSAASLMNRGTLPLDYLRHTRALHVSGISQAISEGAADAVVMAIETARSAGALVAYDTNLRTRLWPVCKARPVIHQALALCHIALPGFDDAVALTGLTEPDAIADFYLSLGAQVVALTLGDKGALVATAQERQHLPAVPAAHLVDATGAGDAFDGAFLAEYLKDADPFRAAAFANAAASLSVRGFGAIEPLPRRQQVEALVAA
ncbi:MAG: sugar kinase [Gammaproteobacteria bacterium]|nr:sugar kinase [Gammaproteobacteria bacterium]